MSKIGKISCLGSFTGTIEFTWVIENFNEFTADVGQRYTSGNYYPDKSLQKNNYWYLDMYPGGYSSDSAPFISLYLYYTHANPNHLYAIYTFKITNEDGKTLCLKSSSRDFLPHLGVGFSKLIRRDELLSKLKDDAMIIRVEVNYALFDNVFSFYAMQNIDLLKPTFDNKSLEKKLHEDLKALLRDTETSDAVISVDGVELPVHTTILSARSKVFASMIKQNTSRRIEITDFKVNTVKSLLQFIYSASIDDTNTDSALDLLKAADKYDLSDLKEYCSDHLMARVNDKNILRILTTADMCNASGLREDAVKYFCARNMKLDLKKDCCSLAYSPELLLDIIERLKEIQHS